MGKNVLVIGASGDIGSAIAIELAEHGYQLMLHYNQNKAAIDNIRNKLDLECVLAEIKADLTKADDLQKLLTELVFPVDHIIFASGNAHYGLFQETSEKVMDDMLAIHVKAPWLISKYLLPPMIKRKKGKIIFISSIWGDIGASYEVVYSAVKGAQNSFVKALAKEVGSSGISVNAVSPGFINTKMNGHLLAEEMEMILSEIPMNRAGTPVEVAHVVNFLMDEKSNYINGDIIRLNGGW